MLGTFVVLLSSTFFRHTDVGDAQVYQVVARNMVADGEWLSLRYLPAVHPRFHEHLPFGFWPMAAAMRAMGEWALRPLFTLMSLGVVLLGGAMARRLAGPWAGLAAMVVLATTEKFFFQAGYPLLDPPLLLLATASAFPIFAGKVRAREWALSAVLAAGAVAVKGPFGLVPPLAAILARAVADRSWRILWIGGAMLCLAAAPVAAFLAASPAWWEGYVVHQIIDSVTGVRSDGRMDRLYAVKTIVGRFWPWLPLVVPGAVLALGWPRRAADWLSAGAQTRRAAAIAGLACAAAALTLSLPARKIWHHTLVAYPLLAVLCGVAVGPRLARLLSTASRARRAVWALACVLAASLFASAAGLDRLLMDPPCAVATEFSGELAAVRPGTAVLVVSDRDEWDVISALAYEHRVQPWPAGCADEAPSEVRGAPLAMVKEALWPACSAWRELSRGRGWVLAARISTGT
ncbi:MAG: hypothetical protein HYZ28_22110 [Myxococcales bacterium]|nr:hypothetical protein [Myxococcales bacterium]